MNEIAQISEGKSWLDQQVRSSSFTEALAEFVMPSGELAASIDAVQERINVLYAASDDALREPTEIIRDHIYSTDAWKLLVKDRGDGSYKIVAETELVGPDGEKFVINIIHRNAQTIPGLIDSSDNENDTQHRVRLLLEHSTNAVVFFADVAGSKKHGIDDLDYTNVYIGNDIDKGLAKESEEDASRVLRDLAHARATIIAEEMTGSQEYHELLYSLRYDVLPSEEREAMLARAVDINALNGIFDREVDGWKDRFFAEKFYYYQEKLSADTDVWDEYSQAAARKKLLSESNHVYMADRLRIQRKAAVAIQALQLTTAQAPKLSS